MLERVRRERQAGIHELGILHTDDPERYLQAFDFLLENTDDLIDFWLVHRR